MESDLIALLEYLDLFNHFYACTVSVVHNPIQKQLIAVEKGRVQVKQIDMYICDKK